LSVEVVSLSTYADLREAVDLQQAALGMSSTAIWHLPHLLSVLQSGGVILGTREAASGRGAPCDGLLVDLTADVDGYPAQHTVCWLVRDECRGHGLGMRLRSSERRLMQQRGVDLVFWGVDPLDSHGLYVSLNRLGGIVTGYTYNTLGTSREGSGFRPATDQLRIEWWVDSPRVNDRMDWTRRPGPLPIGLSRMEVLTETTRRPSGVRGLIGGPRMPTSEHALMEIPEALPVVMERDRDAALYWRVRSRDVLEPAFRQGYVGVGVLHEAGRSFLYLKKGNRRTELGEPSRPGEGDTI
jgi:predicted GNAT superfamily acetyltransferase